MNRGNPYATPLGAYTRRKTLDVTTKHTVSSCPAALLLDGEAGIGKTTIEAAGRCLFRVLACSPVEPESARFFAALADLLEGIPEDPK